VLFGGCLSCSGVVWGCLGAVWWLVGGVPVRDQACNTNSDNRLVFLQISIKRAQIPKKYFVPKKKEMSAEKIFVRFLFKKSRENDENRSLFFFSQ